jgi:putative nucleotidyltransferase with HDIG domain
MARHSAIYCAVTTDTHYHEDMAMFADQDPSSILLWAQETAARWLDVPEFRGRRWRHVQAVGAKAELLAPAFAEDGPLLAASAWLHDIGYAPQLQETGFHPIDGARELDREGVEPRISRLVANHSGACIEARLRGLVSEMSAYPDDSSAVRDALWTCDMTTSPVGDPVDFEDRLDEIKKRYGAEHTVPRAIDEAGDEIRAAIHRTRSRAIAHGIRVNF